VLQHRQVFSKLIHPASCDDTAVFRLGRSFFPEHGDEQIKAGTSRNLKVFGPLEFLAEVARHIPKKGPHQNLYLGSGSHALRGNPNKQSGMRKKKKND
jgi:hypothetical protein